MIILETKRLTINEIEIEDSSFIFELLNTPTYIKNIGDRNIKTQEQAKDYTQNMIDKKKLSNNIGFYIMRAKEDQEIIGTIGFVDRPELNGIDFGYAILPQYEGKGYTSEAAVSVMAYGRDVLHIDPVLGITSQDNIPSQKILKKVGMHFVKNILFGEEQEEIMLFSTQK